MAHVIRQLGQLRPADTNAVSIYSPASGIEASFRITIANTTAIAATYRIFVDEDGTTYDENTALAFNTTIEGGDSVTFPAGTDMIRMNLAAGNCAVRTSTASALTFTAQGEEISPT